MYPFGNTAWKTFKYLMWPAILLDPQDPDAAPQAKTVRRRPADSPHDLRGIAGPQVFEISNSAWQIVNLAAVAPSDQSRYRDVAARRNNRPGFELKSGDLIITYSNDVRNIFEPDGARPSSVAAKLTHVMHERVRRNGSLVCYLTAFNEGGFDAIKRDKTTQQRPHGPISDRAHEDVPPYGIKAPDGSNGTGAAP